MCTKSKMRQWRFRILIIAAWCCIWQAMCDLTGLDFVLASPVSVFTALISLIKTSAFYSVLINSFVHITIGFVFACILAVVLGIFASKCIIIYEILLPLIQVMKSLPVASFIILLLILFGSSKVSALISFIVVFPMIYNSVVMGMRQTDHKLLEMARIFSIGRMRTIKYIYMPEILSYTKSSLKTALGMSWKAGVSAEVIGLAKNSIGEQLYYAKLYLMTEQLFAWSIVVVGISLICERFIYSLLQQWENYIFKHKITGKMAVIKSVQDRIETVRVDNLCKSYHDKKVLQGFCAQFYSDKINCIMGKSGIGKTTLLKSIMGLLPTEGGTISITGKIGVIFQEDRLIEQMTVMNNIMLVLGDTSKSNELRVRKQLAAILPTECLDMPAGSLSGGQKRRVAIARALLCTSDICLMDEPFTGLDHESIKMMIEFVKQNTRGKVTIIVTHSDAQAKALDSRIYLLTSGSTVATIQ